MVYNNNKNYIDGIIGIQSGTGIPTNRSRWSMWRVILESHLSGALAAQGGLTILRVSLDRMHDFHERGHHLSGLRLNLD